MSFTRKKVRLGLAAASVALAANVAPANAAVIYSGEVNINIGVGGPSGRTFPGNGAASFILDGVNFGDPDSVTAVSKTGTAVLADTSPTFNPNTMGNPAAVGVGAGELIDVSFFRTFYSEGHGATLYSDNGTPHAFNLGEGGIVPFALRANSIGPNSNFGWIRFASGATLESVVLVDFAYEDVSGASIRAGDTGISPVPLPASLPLALAGIGVLGWMGRLKRRRK